MKRESTGKRLRFRIFERDSFTCQYCGKHPPEVILHLDHVFPISKGGKNEDENLVTSCADCNMGKAAFEIGNFPKTVKKNKEDFQEKYEQLRAFYNLQKKMDTMKRSMVTDVNEYWFNMWCCDLNTKGLATIRMFLKSFSVEEINEAISISRSRTEEPENSFKYMCGILHNKLKQKKIPDSSDHTPKCLQ